MRGWMLVASFVVAGVVGASAAFAQEPQGAGWGAADASRPVSVPETLPVVGAPKWHANVPPAADAEAILVGGPEAGPKPCGPCRLGYDDCGRARWGGSLWFGAWFWGATGTVGADGREADVDISPSDSVDMLKNYGEGALTGGGRLDYGRCSLRMWLSYVRLEGAGDSLVTGEPVESSYEGFTAEITASYRVAEIALGCSPCAPCLAIEPFVGTRYNSMETEIEGTQVTAKGDNDWWDLIVGCDARFDFRNKWFASLSASVGGFGLASDFTWSARADVGYMFTPRFGAFLGLAAISWDYEDGDFQFDMTQWGPYIGLVVAF